MRTARSRILRWRNFQGTDTFTYTITDSKGASDTATVTINVGNKNDTPMRWTTQHTVPEDSSNNFIPVLANDTDIDGDPLFVSSVTPPAKSGTVTIVPGDAKAGGGVLYTPNTNFFGADSFTYTISDGKGGTDTAKVTVIVSNDPDAPSPVDDKFTRVEDTTVTFTAAELTGNDFNPDKTALVNLEGAQSRQRHGRAQWRRHGHVRSHGQLQRRRQIRVRGRRRQQGRPRPGDHHLHAGQRPADRGQRCGATDINTAVTVTSAPGAGQ